MQLLESVIQAEHKVCTTEGLFKMLDTKFKPQYYETIKSLQFCKVMMQANESTEEWMGWAELEWWP